jgi:hypothetical protein
MAKVLFGSETYPKGFMPRRIGNYTAHHPVKYAACSVSNFNEPNAFGDAVAPRSLCNASMNVLR